VFRGLDKILRFAPRSVQTLGKPPLFENREKLGTQQFCRSLGCARDFYTPASQNRACRGLRLRRAALTPRRRLNLTRFSRLHKCWCNRPERARDGLSRVAKNARPGGVKCSYHRLHRFPPFPKPGKDGAPTREVIQRVGHPPLAVCLTFSPLFGLDRS
jgi:hypothetical protein